MIERFVKFYNFPEVKDDLGLFVFTNSIWGEAPVSPERFCRDLISHLDQKFSLFSS